MLRVFLREKCTVESRKINLAVLTLFQHPAQFTEGFDDGALCLGEETARVVENRRQPGAKRADDVCEIIIAHVDGFIRVDACPFQSMFEDGWIGFEGFDFAARKRKAEV